MLYIVLVVIFKNIVNIHAESYSNYTLFMVTAIVGTFMIVLLSNQIEKAIGYCAFTKWLVFIGQNTFVYYAFQSKIIRFIDLAYGKINIHISDYLRNPLYAVVACAVLAIPAMIINKYFPILLGKKKF